MNYKFLTPHDPILTKVAKKISKNQINLSEVRKIVEAMLKVAQGEQKNKKRPVMVGLAAPQIGISKRIILVDVKANGKGKVGDLRVYINPQITWTSKQKEEWYEGCYSTSRVCGIVKRSNSIKVRGYTLKSLGVLSNTPPRWDLVLVEEKYTGYLARIFQHEIDHLNGKVFVDLIKDPDKLHWVKKSEFPLYRNKQAWRNWPKKCSFGKWREIKGIK